jgi:SAM-dependent methyltransferase
VSAPSFTTRFGEAADRYERFRTGYAEAAFDVLEREHGLGPGAHVVDVGCGTGIATAALAARGARVTGVEPDPGMRERATRLLAGRAGVVAGSAESIPLADGCADLVVAAQAAHWFDEPAASREVQRVLRPGGTVAYLWKMPDPRDPLDAAMLEEVARLGIEVDASGRSLSVWPPLLDPGFSGYERRVLEHGVHYTVERYVGMLSSTSMFIELDEQRRGEVEEAVGRRVRSLRGDGSFVEPNLVYLFTARRPG